MIHQTSSIFRCIPVFLLLFPLLSFLYVNSTTTHMAPELFTWGHISKSSDVYAFGDHGPLLFLLSINICH